MIANGAGDGSPWIRSNTGPSNDNVATPRVSVREAFAAEQFVSTRRRLKLASHALAEGSVGQIIRVRSLGRLYDVSFPFADGIVMTLSHCDIARYQGATH